MRLDPLTPSLLAAGALAAACTTLGPMAAMTGTTPLPPERTSFELQVGALPGYFLSSVVKQEPAGQRVDQAALLVDLGELVRLPGLAVGGRYVGKSAQGGYPEPLLGYRRYLDRARRVAGALFAFGAHADGAEDGASFEATRGGLEAAFDLRATPESRRLELHLVGAASLVAVRAEGSYCLDADGRFGIDCGDPPVAVTRERASGLYPSGALALAADGGRHRNGLFHGARLALLVAAGALPRVESGHQRSPAGYASLGLSLTLALGARR